MEGVPNVGYDRAIVTFSPDGRLYQVEYAREAVKRGMTCLGVTFDVGVILAAVRPIGQLAIPTIGSDKIHQLDDHLGAAISGFLADGRILIDGGRIKSQIYKMTYDESINVMGIVRDISDRMQLFTQYGGVRPYGVALLVGGIDETGAKVFEIDPSSAFYAWKAQAIGKGAPEADAIKLAISALRAAEKGVRPQEVELVVIDSGGFKEYHGSDSLKFIKRHW